MQSHWKNAGFDPLRTERNQLSRENVSIARFQMQPIRDPNRNFYLRQRRLPSFFPLFPSCLHIFLHISAYAAQCDSRGERGSLFSIILWEQCLNELRSRIRDLTAEITANMRRIEGQITIGFRGSRNPWIILARMRVSRWNATDFTTRPRVIIEPSSHQSHRCDSLRLSVLSLLFFFFFPLRR